MKSIEQYFQVVLFIMLYKVVLTFKSVDDVLDLLQRNEENWDDFFLISCSRNPLIPQH